MGEDPCTTFMLKYSGLLLGMRRSRKSMLEPLGSALKAPPWGRNISGCPKVGADGGCMAARGEDASMVAVDSRQKPQRLGSGLRASCLMGRRREAVRMDCLEIACEVGGWTWTGARDWETGTWVGDYLAAGFRRDTLLQWKQVGRLG